MDKPLEALTRLSTDLQNWAQTQWARWTGNEDSVAEIVYWSMKDLLNFAADPEPPFSAALQQALSSAVLEAQDTRFVARDTALESLRAALKEWRDGRPSMVAVHGLQGAGISSLLAQIPTLIAKDEQLISTRFCQRLHNSNDVVALLAKTLALDTIPDSVAELVNVLQQTEPRIIVLDDAYMLTYRIMGTRAAMRTLGSIMVATQLRHLWILAFRHHAWQRLIYLYQADRYFSHNIELKYFNTDELKQMITQRFKNAQIELDWPDSDWSRLQKYSRGKPDLAILYAQRLQAEVTPDEDQPEVLRPIDLSPIKSLEMDDLFSLAELAVHGSLHSTEHQQIFRESADGSLMRLEHLRILGLVEHHTPVCGDTTPAYRITRLLSGLIAEHLYKLNYLY